jgi:hypothetical protein
MGRKVKAYPFHLINTNRQALQALLWKYIQEMSVVVVVFDVEFAGVEKCERSFEEGMASFPGVRTDRDGLCDDEFSDGASRVLHPVYQIPF